MGFGFYVSSRKEAIAPMETVVESPVVPVVEEPPANAGTARPKAEAVEVRRFEKRAPESVEPPAPAPSVASTPAITPSRLAVDQAVEKLMSPQSTYEQRQAAWKQLKNSGRMDD